jgi:hypothetical protein
MQGFHIRMVVRFLKHPRNNPALAGHFQAALGAFFFKTERHGQ